MKPNILRKVGAALVIALVVIILVSVAAQIWNARSIGTTTVASKSLLYGRAIISGGAPSVAVMNEAAVQPEMMPPIYQPPGAGAQDRSTVDQKIITTGSVSIRVDNATKRLDEIKTIAKDKGGFVASSNLNDVNGTKSGSITLRIPSAKYDETVAAVKKLALVVFDESSNAEDVTAQFVDLNARLKAAQAEETQYLEILKRAYSIEDTLKVTAQLGDVRSRIEQMQGQLRYLNDRTDYATLTIQLTEETHVQVPTRNWKPLETIKAAFASLVSALQVLVDTLITAIIFLVGFLVPILLVLWLIYLGVRAVWRKFSK